MKKDFPLLSNSNLIYFDSASTSQKPASMISAEREFYEKHNANIHRGIYPIAEEATHLYEEARATVARFINAQPEEIIFTRGTTESINMVALSWGMEQISSGDGITVTALEHHANFVPWQQLAKKKDADFSIIPLHDDGTLRIDDLDSYIMPKTKIVAITHESNVLGVCNDLNPIIARSHAVGARVLVDAAQSIAHQPIDVRETNCDFLAFSGHKMLGPTGIGVLYIKKEVQTEMPPLFFGGGMILSVSDTNASWQQAPQKYEAGTPPIAQAIGLKAAIDYITQYVDFDTLRAHEAALCARLIDGLQMLPQVRIYGPIDQLKTSGHMVSFTIDGYHPHDIAAYLASHGICVRAGSHCAQPLTTRLCVEGLVRSSFYLYNTHDEVEFFLKILKQLF